MHMRHGYCLKRTHYAYSGTKELAMEKLRRNDKKKKRMDEKTEKKEGCRKSPSHRTTGRDWTSGA